MALASDLLRQAELLARHDRRRPRQANLRRAVSSAYYALFHMLTADATAKLLPRSARTARLAFVRAFGHMEMAEACRAMANPRTGVVALFPNGIPPQLVQVGRAFIHLQQARHEADYDLRRAFTRSEAQHFVSMARNAFLAWAQVRKTDAARVFLVVLIAIRALRRTS